MEPAIIFFDDNCVLCSRSVQFIYRYDRKGRFRFASLDSQAFGKISHRVEGFAGVPEIPGGKRLDPGNGKLRAPGTGKRRDPGTGTRLASAAGTVILYMNEKVYARSAAALHIVSRLRFPVSLLAAGWIVPPFLRDAVYDWIARNRYRWFGKRDTCFVPEGGLKDRVLH
jgi:predicted DCC family thiol-disulfide oxidoreductase YuxK